MFLGFILGLVIGTVLGLTGAGGGVLAVPVLVFGFRMTMQQAAPVALIAVTLSAGLGAFEGLRKGQVRYKAATLMAGIGAPMTYVGQLIARSLAQSSLMLAFSVVMLVVAFRMFHQRNPHSEQELQPQRVARINPETGKFIWDGKAFLLLSVVGATTGFMTGLLGVGGGFFIVPMLKRFTEVTIHGIVATSLLVITLLGSAALVGAFIKGVSFDLTVTIVFASAISIGMLLARRVAHRVPPLMIQRGFALVLSLVAMAFLIRVVLWR